MNRNEILERARECVCGDREQDYGSPEDNFQTIAELWEAYIRSTCVPAKVCVCVEPKDVAAMMALLKIARIASDNAKEDNWVDLAGYAACGGELDGIKIKAQEAIVKVYEYSAVGSGLHIVLDDGNVDDADIQWCLENSIPKIEDKEERSSCQRCAELLLEMPLRDRKRLVSWCAMWG